MSLTFSKNLIKIIARYYGLMPLKVIEKLLYDKQIGLVVVPPLTIILGHWRSGTTILQRLLCSNFNYGYISSTQTVLPEFSVLATNYIPNSLNLISHITGQTHHAHKIPWSWDFPGEEDIALGLLGTKNSSIWPFLMPNKLSLERCMDFDLDEELEFFSEYDKLLKKAAYLCGQKPLVLKNPINTGRIAYLSKRYSGTKYLYIYRDPKDVFYSTFKMWYGHLGRYGLGSFDQIMIKEKISSNYCLLLSRYAESRHLIVNDLFELHYDNLVTNAPAVLDEMFSMDMISGSSSDFDLRLLEQHKPEEYKYCKDDNVYIERMEKVFALVHAS